MFAVQYIGTLHANAACSLKTLKAFFLKKLRGGLCGLQDLPSLDQQLYKSLRFLRHTTDNVQDLGLFFTVTDESNGEPKEVCVEHACTRMHAHWVCMHAHWVCQGHTLKT